MQTDIIWTTNLAQLAIKDANYSRQLFGVYKMEKQPTFNEWDDDGMDDECLYV